jgi:hypothetical protein
MNSISPVYSTETVNLEKVIALDQPEYFPIIILPVKYPDGTQGMCVRFELSSEERGLIADGADLLLTELTFGSHKFTPVSLQVVPKETSDAA